MKVDQFGTGYLDTSTNKYSGFDWEIAKVVSEAVSGFAVPNIVPVSSNDRESKLEDPANNLSFFVATYSMTPRREAQFYLAGPYLTTQQGFMVKLGGNKVRTLEDLRGKQVCVNGDPKADKKEGSLSASVLLDTAKSYGINLRTLDSYSACLDEVISGRMEAFSTDMAILYGYEALHPKDVKVVDDLTVGETKIEYGVAFRKSDIKDCELARDALVDMVKSGAWSTKFRGSLPRYAEAEPQYETRLQPNVDLIMKRSCKKN